MMMLKLTWKIFGRAIPLRRLESQFYLKNAKATKIFWTG